MQRFELLDFPSFSDFRGETVPFEFDEKFPFSVQRAYLVTGKNGEVRGGHAHKKEKEVFVCASGSVKAIVHDGKKEQEIILNTKKKALFVNAGCWHEFRDFSHDGVLLAFSSTHYEGREEYIEDKNEFLKESL